MNKYFPLKKIKPSKDIYGFFDGILELISVSTNAVCTSFSPKGEQAGAIFNHNGFCEKLSKILPKEIFEETCVNQHKEAFSECVKCKKPIFFHCSFGLLNYIVPVGVDDEDAYIFVGQVLSDKANGSFLEELCKKFPEVKKAVQNYNGLARIKPSKLKEIVKSFSQLLEKEIKRFSEIHEKSEKLLSFRREMQSYFVEIGAAMGSSLNLHNLLNLVVQASARLVNASSGSICLIENKDMVTRVTYGDYFKKEIIGQEESLSVKEDLIGWDEKNKTAFFHSPAEFISVNESRDENVKSYLGIPLLIKDEVKGILNIYDNKIREFSLEEIDMLVAFANQAALAIDNIQLFHYEQTKAREAANLYNAVKIIGQSLNLNEVVNLSTQQMIKIAEVNRCIMFLYDDESSSFNFAGSAGLSEDQVEFFSMLKMTLADFKENIWEEIKQGQCVFFDKAPQSCKVLQRIYTSLPSNSCLIIPLFTKEGLIGLFYIDDSNIAKTFTQAETKVIMTLAVQIAMAIQRASLLNRLEENFNDLKSLYSVSTSLVVLRLEKIYELIVEKSSELLRLKDVSLIMFNDEKNQFELAAHNNIDELLTNKKAIEKTVKFIGGRKKPVICSTVSSQRSALKEIMKKTGKNTALCLPMYSKNKFLGIVSVFTDKTIHFSEQQIRLIQSFINQAVVSIENALLYKIVQNKVKELATLFEVGKSVISSLHFDKVLDEIVENIMKVVHSDAVSIMLLDEDAEELTIKTMKGLGHHHYREKIKIGEGVAGIAAKTGHPMMIIDSKKIKSTISFPDRVRKDNLKTILSVPLQAKGRVIGLLNLYAKDIYYYSKAEVNLLSTLANQAAVALENAMLYREQYEIAQIIQSSLMPEFDIKFNGVEIGSKYIPSLKISGDYYDLVPLEDKKFAVYIADVAGKGTGAAIYTVRGKYVLKSFSSVNYEPKEVLNNLNRILYPETEAEKFISVFYAVVDLEKNSVRYSSAGHEPAILYKSRENEIKLLTSDGILIGVEESAYYGQEEVVVEKGDILALYTDGITEARSGDGEFFGIERLKDVVNENKHLPPQKIAERIHNEVQKFAYKRLSDDFTLLVIKF